MCRQSVVKKTTNKNTRKNQTDLPHIFQQNLPRKQTKTNSKEREGGRTVGSGRVVTIVE